MDENRAMNEDYEDPKRELKSISFKNFRPFHGWQTFYPGRLNILIGPNNSGKSTFGELLKLMSSDKFPNQFTVDSKYVRETSIENYFYDPKLPFEVKFNLKYKVDPKYIQYKILLDTFHLCTDAEVHLKYVISDKNYAILNYVDITDKRSKISILKFDLSNNDRVLALGWKAYYSTFNDAFSKIDELFFLPKPGNVNNQKMGTLKSFKLTSAKEEQLDHIHGSELLEKLSVRKFHLASDNWADSLFHSGIHIEKWFKSGLYPQGNKNSEEFQFDDYIDLPTAEDLNNAAYDLLGSNEKESVDYFKMEGLIDFIEYYFANIRMLFADIEKGVPKFWNVSLKRLQQNSVYTEEDLNQIGLVEEIRSKGKEDSDAINKWLRTFGIADSLKIEHVVDNLVTLSLNRHGKYLPINRVGYGSLQIVSLLLARNVGMAKNSGLLRAGRSSIWPGLTYEIISLEEPEANLHPKLQSLLADLFVDSVNNKYISLLIETHSEFLIRKLQYLVAKSEISAIDVSIHYFEEIKPSQKSGKMRRIRVRDDGFLMDSFGEGFFDESARWTFELLKIQNQN